MQRDYFYPPLADRASPTVWAEQGAKDIWQIAREKVRDILAMPDPGYLEATADKAIRAKHRILLD
jgi:trimethylamine--corrinoid protein Co-methyltransferase